MGVRLFASPVWPLVNQLPRHINTLWRCEQFGRWGETGEKINVLAFYTSWSGFKLTIHNIVKHNLFTIDKNSTNVKYEWNDEQKLRL